MPKRKRTRKYSKRRYKRRGTLKKTIKAVVRKAIKPVQSVIRLQQAKADQTITASVNYFNLSLISGMTAIFNTLPTDVDPRSAKHVKLNLDVLIEAATENDGCTITAYIVSIKANTPDNFFDANTGALQLGPNGTTFSEQAGMAYVNPEYFNIHMRKRMYFAPRPVGEDQSIGTNFRRFTWNFKPNMMIRNNAGRFDSLVCPQKPTQNYYLMVFNNNSGQDFEWPTVTYHVLNTYIA